MAGHRRSHAPLSPADAASLIELPSSLLPSPAELPSVVKALPSAAALPSLLEVASSVELASFAESAPASAIGQPMTGQEPETQNSDPTQSVHSVGADAGHALAPPSPLPESKHVNAGHAAAQRNPLHVRQRLWPDAQSASLEGEVEPCDPHPMQQRTARSQPCASLCSRLFVHTNVIKGTSCPPGWKGRYPKACATS